MLKRMFSIAMLLSLFWAGASFAFTEMTLRTLERNIQKAAQGNRQAKQQVTNLWRQQLSKIDTKSYTVDEALSRMQKLAEQKKIPAYILERGQYKYAKDNNAAYVIGENVFLRSQPNTKARIVTKLNTTITTYVSYLGEWRHPNTGDKWFCVKTPSGDVGWIFGRYIELVSNSKFQNIVSQLNERNATVAPAVSKDASNSSLRLISRENYLHKTLKKYSFRGFMVWLVIFVLCSLLGKFTLYDALNFIFWSVIAILGCIALCYILYYVVWQGIILPILKFIAAVIGGILLLMSLGDGCSNTSCPFYPKHNCVQCNTCRR